MELLNKTNKLQILNIKHENRTAFSQKLVMRFKVRSDQNFYAPENSAVRNVNQVVV